MSGHLFQMFGHVARLQLTQAREKNAENETKWRVLIQIETKLPVLDFYVVIPKWFLFKNEIAELKYKIFQTLGRAD